MTPEEVFDVKREAYQLWRKQAFPGRNSTQILYVAWLAAWSQGRAAGLREAADLIEHHVNGRGSLRQQLSDAIRGRVGEQESS